MGEDDGRPARVQSVVHGCGGCVRQIHYNAKTVHLFDHQLDINKKEKGGNGQEEKGKKIDGQMLDDNDDDIG